MQSASSISTLVIECFVLAIIALVVYLLKPSLRKKYSYQKKDYFMDAAEHELFVVLYELYSEKYYIFAQVHLNTLLSDGHNHAAFRHIDEKSVDFVLCDKRGIRPVVAIEYDGHSHDEPRVKISDAEKDRIFKEAGLPLVRIRNHGRVVKEEVISFLADALSKTS